MGRWPALMAMMALVACARSQPPPPDATEDVRWYVGDVDIEVWTKPTPEPRYGPEHVLAIWIETDDGIPLRVLGHWGGFFALRLYTFNRAFNLEPGELPSDPDTVTGATLRTHDAPQHVAWNLRDSNGDVLPYRDYQLWVEIADGDEGVHTTVPFTVGPEPFVLDVDETTEIGMMRIAYTPTTRLTIDSTGE